MQWTISQSDAKKEFKGVKILFLWGLCSLVKQTFISSDQYQIISLPTEHFVFPAHAL